MLLRPSPSPRLHAKMCSYMARRLHCTIQGSVGQEVHSVRENIKVFFFSLAVPCSTYMTLTPS
jgi:hypothetical protein